jgi:hypothetical protein
MKLSEMPTNFRLTLDHLHETTARRSRPPNINTNMVWHASITGMTICNLGEPHPGIPFCSAYGFTPEMAIERSLEILGSWLAAGGPIPWNSADEQPKSE